MVIFAFAAGAALGAVLAAIGVTGLLSILWTEPERIPR